MSFLQDIVVKGAQPGAGCSHHLRQRRQTVQRRRRSRLIWSRPKAGAYCSLEWARGQDPVCLQTERGLAASSSVQLPGDYQCTRTDIRPSRQVLMYAVKSPLTPAGHCAIMVPEDSGSHNGMADCQHARLAPRPYVTTFCIHHSGDTRGRFHISYSRHMRTSAARMRPAA